MGRAQRMDTFEVLTDKSYLVWAAYDMLSVLSLSIWKSFLKHAWITMRSMLPDKYSMFTFESLPTPLLVISEILKETIKDHLSSDRVLTKLGPTSAKKNPIDTNAKNFLCKCNTCLILFKMDDEGKGLRIVFIVETSSKWNILFLVMVRKECWKKNNVAL